METVCKYLHNNVQLHALILCCVILLSYFEKADGQRLSCNIYHTNEWQVSEPIRTIWKNELDILIRCKEPAEQRWKIKTVSFCLVTWTLAPAGMNKVNPLVHNVPLLQL